MRRGLLAWIGAALLVGGCALPESSPNEPDPLPEGPATSSVPPQSTPSASPTPTPGLGSPASAPTPEPGGEGEDSGDDSSAPEPPEDPTIPPPGSGCGAPVPPPISRFKVTVHLRGAEAWILDSTPLVGPDVAYCAEIGFTDGRENCPVRPEGHPEREACETWAVGTAVDTGRPGPTWRRNGGFCTGRAFGCENHPENQYLLKVFLSGDYEACTRSGVCGELFVDR